MIDAKKSRVRPYLQTQSNKENGVVTYHLTAKLSRKFQKLFF